MCDDQVSAASAIPTCFTGVEQSPVDLTVNPGTVQEQDPGQISFLGYNDQLGQTPTLRLKDFTVQLDFEETLAISNPTRSKIQPTVKRGEQKQKPKRKKKKKKKKKTKRKKKRKHQGKGKRHNQRRVRRNAAVPSITGGVLGNDT